ncbi:hypothetical protein NXW27_27070 [Phocaeicola dorei]|nr:hypothetical protein [Phocaeicola dorei]
MRDLKKVPSFHSENMDYHGLISTAEYDVPLELMRFFIGFGVRKFNYNKVKGARTGVDSVLYKMEVTPLAEKLERRSLDWRLHRQLGCQKGIVCR